MTAAYRSKNVKTATGTSIAHDAPAGLVDNDILVLLLAKAGTAAVTVPAGFSAPVSINSSGSTFSCWFSWKRASSESGTYTFSWTGSALYYSTLVAYSGALTTGSPLDATPTTVSSGSQTNQITCPSITVVSANSLVIPFGANGTYVMTTAALTGFTMREQDNISVISDAIKAAAGATGDLVYTHTRGAAVTAGITIALTSAPVVSSVPVFMNQYKQRRS